MRFRLNEFYTDDMDYDEYDYQEDNNLDDYVDKHELEDFAIEHADPDELFDMWVKNCYEQATPEEQEEMLDEFNVQDINDIVPSKAKDTIVQFLSDWDAFDPEFFEDAKEQYVDTNWDELNDQAELSKDPYNGSGMSEKDFL